MNSFEEKYFGKLINKYSEKPNKITNYPLASPKPFSNNDLIEGVKVLLSGRFTMSEITKKLSNKMTIIIITHRLSFLKQSNKIFVIEKGKIIDSGNFKDLMSHKDSVINKLIEDNIIKN